jgi:hydrogenase maturation factor HypF (carbamoyltransferase family)
MAKTSYFDVTLHPFKCESPQCGETFEESLRSLFHASEVVCPKCGMSIDIRESKRTGKISFGFRHDNPGSSSSSP